MAVLKPFKGIRPQPELASRVASLPYDVLDSNEARQVASGNPDSFLHVIKPEIDLDASVDTHDPLVYQTGKKNLDAFLDRNLLLRDEKPVYYIYQQIMGQHVQTGLVACASVDEYQNNIVKKHEFTRPDKVNDRVNLMCNLNAQTGPVFLAFKSQRAIKELFTQAMTQGPVYDFVSFFDIRHVFYLVDDDALIERIQQAFAAIPALYIADGHHRSEGAAEYCMQQRKADPEYTGNEAYNYFLTVSFPEDELFILPYNRAVKDLNGMTPEALKNKLQDFQLYKAGPNFTGPDNPSRFGMYLDGDWYLMTAPDAMLAGKDEVQRLDVAILQDHVLAPLLGIDDPRANSRIKFVGGLDSLAKLKQSVDSGEYAVAFSLYPTQMRQVMDVADAGRVMPPKSTWFEPKLLSGMVTHMLDA